MSLLYHRWSNSKLSTWYCTALQSVSCATGVPRLILWGKHVCLHVQSRRMCPLHELQGDGAEVTQSVSWLEIKICCVPESAASTAFNMMLVSASSWLEAKVATSVDNLLSIKAFSAWPPLTSRTWFSYSWAPPHSSKFHVLYVSLTCSHPGWGRLFRSCLPHLQAEHGTSDHVYQHCIFLLLHYWSCQHYVYWRQDVFAGQCLIHGPG